MKLKLIIVIIAAAFIGGGFTTALAAEDHSAHAGIPKDYPLTKCPVSDEAFEHGKPIKVTYEGTDVYLCCKSCVKKFNKEPAKFAQMVKAAAAKRK